MTTTKNKQEKLKREVKFNPAFCSLVSGRGRGSVKMWFVVRGKKGAVTFLIMTGMTFEEDRDHLPETCKIFPLAGDIALHSYKQLDDSDIYNKNCKWRDGKRCYTKLHSLIWAQEVLERFLKEGEESLWKTLEEVYRENLE